MPPSLTSDQIDAVLPQTQCEECGYKGCRPYANAVATGDAEIDLCAPGGVPVLEAIAEIMQTSPTPYLPKVEKNYRPPSVAYIDEDLCIGCMKCIYVCPVDAIVGSVKTMHTIINDECSGCELCIPACPMDCIHLVPVERDDVDQMAKTAKWRKRYEARNLRLNTQAQQEQTQHQAAKLGDGEQARAAKRAAIKAAVERAKNRLSSL
jgi:electron transport complex protein RnfB